MTIPFGLPPEVRNKINSVFEAHPKIEKAVLFGSRAKGNFKAGSDIDLTLEGTDLTLSELLLIENELDDLLLPYKVDLSIRAQIESAELLEHIARVGRDFFSRPTRNL